MAACFFLLEAVKQNGRVAQQPCLFRGADYTKNQISVKIRQNLCPNSTEPNTVLLRGGGSIEIVNPLTIDGSVHQLLLWEKLLD